MGWLYAGSFKEALPGALFYVLLCSLVPRFLLAYLLGPFNAVAAIAGVLYAWSYNRTGRRQTLLLKDSPPPRLPRGR
jgi:4-hydroxybenzoate polyprenyltransferase